MKLLEFLGIIRENDSSGTGTFVGARLTRDSERAIMRWMRDNGLRKKEPRARFHITVVGDKERSFDWNPATFDPPLEVDPSSYKINKFDEGSIVLTFSVPELEKRHEQAVEKYGINWKFPTYQPHLTLSYDPTDLNNIDRLLRPTFPIYVANEYAQPWGFKESDERTNRRRTTRVDEAFLAERNLMNADQTAIFAKQMADSMFGPNVHAQHVGTNHEDDHTVEAVHQWAQKALRKFLINDIPAPQILSFRPSTDSNPVPSGEYRGNAMIAYPRYIRGIQAGHGLLSGQQRERMLTVPYWVPEALEKGEELFWLDDRIIDIMRGSLSAVRDWIRHLARHDPRQLIPARLNRLSWVAAEDAAFAWHDAMKASELDNVEELEGDKEIYLELGNATWWKLTGESCLNREGDMMGHCVADYVDDVENEHSIILSLLDSKNRPHVTVELGRHVPWAKNRTAKVKPTYAIEQVKGKEDKPPVEKYWKYVDELIKKLDEEFGQGTELFMTGEGQRDLAGCGIIELGGMLLRTEPPLPDVECVLNIVQYPATREWSVYDHEEMSLWEALQNLVNRDMVPGEHPMDEEDSKELEYVKWALIRNGEFEVDIRAVADDMFFHDNPDFDRDSIDEENVHTTINIKAPDIKYEVLSGNPKDFKHDINHAIASKESTT